MSNRIDVVANLIREKSRTVAAGTLAEQIDALYTSDTGCQECADMGHAQGCSNYIPSIGELLGMDYD
jgi:hypothetical protein